MGGVLSTRIAKSARALSKNEVEAVVDVLHEIRFLDKAPAQIYASLLDEGTYLCSTSTMYRILRSRDEVRERRQIARRRDYPKPELVATAPNQVWSWDITKLKGPTKGTFFQLYVILDIYSRCVVGWTLANCESASLAKKLISETCERQDVLHSDLIIHSDRGKAMTSKTLMDLFEELGLKNTHNRPYVSNDNAYSESQFKTLKFRPEFPARFGCIEDALSFCRRFFEWYNNEHYHSGIGLMTPATVHYGRADACIQTRQEALFVAFKRNPERFVNGVPKPLSLPEKVFINPPEEPSNVTADTISSVTIIGAV